MNIINYQLDALKFGRSLVGMALACSLSSPLRVSSATLGPLVELSQPNPVGICDNGFRLPGTWTVNDAVEPAIAVNPANPNNVVASYFIGSVQNVIAGVSFNGGRNWQQVAVPLTACSGGPFWGAGDTWLSFAPNGDLYTINDAGFSIDARGVFVNKSTDGGLHWSTPIMVGRTNTFCDHPTITADRTDARFVYAAWKAATNDKLHNQPMFARTTDGGLTWEPERTVFHPPTHTYVDINQVFVLGDGTLVDFIFVYYQPGSKPPKTENLAILRSTDKGQTWSAPVYGPAVTAVLQPNGNNATINPETGQYLSDPGDPAFAQDTRTGILYAVWEDGRFSNFQYNDIAFSMSGDGGLSWSMPIRVNKTPLNIPPLNRQAFLPSVAVLGNGTIGVSYYDFRFNDSNPGLPTDYWIATCCPSPTTPATNPASWGAEARITGSSFDLETVLISGDEPFLGDYIGGLAASGNGFVASFTATDQNGVTSIFARRVQP
jgi:hypothetical protein